MPSINWVLLVCMVLLLVIGVFFIRSACATRTGDVLGSVAAIRYNRENLREWMQPVPVALPVALEQAGARAEVRYQPLGVIGAIVPWNGPVLMGVLAAAGVLTILPGMLVIWFVRNHVAKGFALGRV